MFLFPFLVLGLVFAVLLGGRPSRLAQVPFRLSWTVFLALGLQILLFSRWGAIVGDELRETLHVATYAILIVFAAANFRIWALGPVLLGMVLNAAAIVANGGKMPVSDAAAREAGLAADATANVSQHADRLAFLGDVFAIPSSLPLANVFSVGDVLIGVGTAMFVIYVALHEADDSELNPRRLLEPLRTASYRRLAAGKLVSQVGDWLTIAALIGWIYAETGSTGHVAALLLIRLAPPIVGGSIAVMVLDRLPKDRLLLGIEAMRGCAVVIALAGVIGGEAVFVYAALAVSGALAALSAAAVPSLVPSLLPAEQLPAANAGLGMSKDAAMAVGALGAGVALASFGVTAALVLDLVTFAAAVILYRGLRLPDRGGVEGEGGEPRLGGLRYVLRTRRLLALVAAFATATLATGLTQATLPRFLDGEAGLGASGFGFGIAALATGLLLGEALVGFSRVGVTAGRWIGAGLLVMAGLLTMLGQSDHGATALFLLGAIGFIDGTTDVLFETVVQRETDPARYGSVFGFAYVLMTVTMTGAFAVAPLLNALLAPATVLTSAGVVLSVAGTIALVAMRDPIGALRVPRPEPARSA